MIDDRTDRAQLATWASAARIGGAQLWAQLNHPNGKQPDPNRHPLTTLVAYLLEAGVDAARGPLRWTAR